MHNDGVSARRVIIGIVLAIVAALVVLGVYQFVIRASATRKQIANMARPAKLAIISNADITPPTMDGLSDVAVKQYAKFDFNAGVTVHDDRDSTPTFTVDLSKVNLNRAGNYVAYYTARDNRGNQKTYERQVVVNRVVQPANNPDPEYGGQKIVYLTFDDGPSANTKRILDILDEYGIKATFFVTGNGQRYNQYIKLAHDKGHSIGLHTFSHNYAQVYANDDAFFADIDKVNNMVQGLTGERSDLIRFPGGSSNTVSRHYSTGIMSRLVKEVPERGYQYFDWNCDSTDASGNNVAVSKLIANATACRGNKIVILSHDTAAKSTTVTALPRIIEYYKSRGYTFAALTKNSFPAHHRPNN